MADQLYTVRIAAEEAYKKTFAEFQKETRKTQNYTEQLTKELNFQARAAGKSTDEIQLLRAELRGASADQLKALQAAQNYNRIAQQQAAANGKVNQSFRFMRGGMGQVGHQIQDVAVQAQMGTNAFIILGQQGSQVASLFGPNGAMIGALLAVGAAAAMSFMPGMNDISKAMKKATDTAEGLIDKIDELEGEAKSFAIREAKKQIDDLKTGVDELGVGLLASLRTFGLMAAGIRSSESAFVDLSGVLSGLQKTSIGAQIQIEELEEKIDGTSKSALDLAKSLTEEKDALGLVGDELYAYKADLAGATGEIRTNIIELYRSIDAKKRDIEQTKEQSKADQKYALALRNKKESTDAFLTAQLKQARSYKATKVEAFNLAIAGKELNEIQQSHVEHITHLLGLQDKQIAKEKELAEATKKAAKEKRERDTSESAIEGLRASLMSRSELIDHAYKKEMEIIEKALETKAILENEAFALSNELNEKRIQSQKDLALATASSLISMTASMVNTMKGMVDEGSAMGKAFFVISQAMAAADAIVKGYQTASAITLAYAKLAEITANPGLIAVGKAHAAMAVGAGYATAGMIAGQTLASFEGGGLTGSGVRSGGMDGKGGRMAVVHPNEKIIDLHKGQSQASNVNVSFNIQANDTKGFDELLQSRRGQIVSMINRAINDKGRRSLA